MILARPYQRDCIDAVERGWTEFVELGGRKIPVRRQLVVCSTGGGKTLIFSWLAQRNPGRTLILAHRTELVSQPLQKLKAAAGIIGAREQGEDRASLNAKVVVASLQSLMRPSRLARWPSNHFDLVVYDEAHHALSDSAQAVLRHFDGHAKVVGFTATPNLHSKKNLGQYFQKTAYEISLFGDLDYPETDPRRHGLVRLGYLAPITIKSVPLRIDLSSVEVRSTGNFDEGQVGSALEPYLGQIAKAVAEDAGFRRTLAFLPLIATSKKFVDACIAHGIRARHVDGQMEDRNEVLEAFAAGEFDLLSNSQLTTEGYDIDSGPTGVGIDCILPLSPTKSESRYIQQIGRGTRLAELKENLLVLDPLFSHQKHRICRPSCLIAKSDIEADIITEMSEEGGGPGQMALDLQDLATAATEKREEALRKKLAEAAKKQGVTYSAEEFAMKHNALGVAEYEPTMPWESEPVTDRQKHVLKRARIDLATVKGKGHASKLIGLHYSEPTAASAAQRAAMRRMGAENWETATSREAQQFFAQNKRRKGVAA